MNGTKHFAEDVGEISRRAFCLVRSNSESSYGLGRSENVGLSNENIGGNPMPRKPKGSLARFVH
jgi:hypothetical protein